VVQSDNFAVRNSELVDPTNGLFTVLGLVSLHLGGPYWWHSEDINNEMARGAVFRAYELGGSERAGLDVASITVADVTDDPTEPDISELSQCDILSLDDFLYKGIQEQLAADGMQLIQWMRSELNQADNLKGLVTPYIVMDQGKERQFIALRIKAKGRKVVIIGVFDIAKKEVLAKPIFNTLRDMVVLA